MPPKIAMASEPLVISPRPNGMSIMSIVPNHLFLQFALAFVLCAIACGMILAGRLTVQRGTGTKTWPAASGVVIDSAVAADRDGGRQRFRPVVRYRYEVDGQRYEGSRIQWTMDQGYRKYTRARHLLDRYRNGSVVTVHYDPSRPGSAVLQTGGSNTAVL